MAKIKPGREQPIVKPKGLYSGRFAQAESSSKVAAQPTKSSIAVMRMSGLPIICNLIDKTILQLWMINQGVSVAKMRA